MTAVDEWIDYNEMDRLDRIALSVITSKAPSFTEHCIITDSPLFPAEKCPLNLLKLLRFKAIRASFNRVYRWASRLIYFLLILRESLANVSNRYFDVFEPGIRSSVNLSISPNNTL